MDIPFFLEMDKTSLRIKNGYSVSFYIPNKYFDSSVAYQDGAFLNVLGLFLYDVYKNGKKEFRDPKLFYYPTIFTAKPDKIEKGKDDIYNGMEYKEVIFNSKDSEVISTIFTIKNAVTAEKVLRLLLRGAIPPIIPYEDLYKIINDSALLNGISFNNIAGLEGIIISEICRSKTDLSKRFIDDYSKGLCGNKDYVMVNLNDLPKLNNALSALTSYDKNIAVAAAINLSSKGDGKISELEKAIMR